MNWQRVFSGKGNGGLGLHVSLRLKSYIVYGALIVGTTAVTVFVLSQKGYLLDQFEQLQSAYEAETRLREVDLIILHTIQAQVASIESIGIDYASSHTREHLRLLMEFFNHVVARHIDQGPDVNGLQAALRRAYDDTNRETMSALGKELNELRRKLEARLAKSREYRKVMADEFRERSDRVALIAQGLLLVVFAMLGVINALFFTRLTEDVRSLKKTAQEIASGRGGGRVQVTRRDEVGDLGHAINQMASEIEQHARALELERRKSFQQEKMAAIGTLAAGIAHEVGNPIAAIAGLMEELKKGCASATSDPQTLEKLDMVLEQTARLTAITREVSTFARPQPNEKVLLNLNELIRSTCSLMRYDKRWKGIEVEMALDGSLPAIEAVPDQLMQVIMNLLVNAADAVEGLVGRHPTIRIATGVAVDGKGVYLEVNDNGVGMDELTLRHATEAFFTTKEAGKGTGMGLFLCHSIISAYDGGELSIASTPNHGTEIKLRLPLLKGGTTWSGDECGLPGWQGEAMRVGLTWPGAR